MIEQMVHERCPRSARTSNGVADAHDGRQIASGKRNLTLLFHTESLPSARRFCSSRLPSDQIEQPTSFIKRKVGHYGVMVMFIARKKRAMADKPDWSTSFASASNAAMGFYDDIMVPRMFEPWAVLMLDHARLRGGEKLLDVACGPGTVTRLAAQRVGPAGSVTGCDFSPAMLDLARSKVTLPSSAPIEYLECSADALDVPDDTFDIVTCQQGLQFFPDRRAALREMRRAMRAEGELLLSVWCDIALCPPFAALADALDDVLGAESAKGYERGPWGFGNPETLAQVVNDSGFADVEVRKYELPLVFEGGPDQLLLTLQAASVASAVAQLSDDGRRALARAVEEATRSITHDGIVRSYATSHVVTAVAGDQVG
jgi:SAM-dependent methyltransferase